MEMLASQSELLMWVGVEVLTWTVLWVEGS